MYHKFLSNILGGLNSELKYFNSREINQLFPIHCKSFPGFARKHQKLCTSVLREASFRNRFCSSWFCRICFQERSVGIVISTVR